MRVFISRMTFSYLCALILFVLCGVFGADTDEVKSVSVTEGDSVTLHTDVTEVRRYDQILWMFGPKETRIAEIYNQMFKSKDIFGDRLQMNSFTGSLTIRNIRTTDAGLYKLQIHDNSRKSEKIFNLTVYARLPVPVITGDSCSTSSGSSVSRCSLLCSVLNVSHVTLSWFKGHSLLSSISVSDLSISHSLPLEVEYQEKNTYSCVINNPISNQTQHLDISEVCQPSSESSRSLFLIVVFLLLLLLLTVVVMLIFCHRNYTQAKQDGG
ncbi:SLAM family member 5-like [Onychostoma macrolepis]|uniref:SLAM family member 5-like n=1 Tax=Onychostoma macrolepis TaxID=369639 RepID=UPI00272CA666|nr:SLAM family member 5-like [Onychostoma macrolepis]